MPTVPVRASCVALLGQANWIALGGGALGGGALGRDTCATDWRCCGLRGAGLTVTCDNGAAFGSLAAGCCAGVAGGDGDASDGVDGACCAGAAGGDGVASEGAAGEGAAGVCSVGGEAWARTPLAVAAASAM